MRNRLTGIAFILFGFLIVYTASLLYPWVPAAIQGVFPPVCDAAGLLSGVIGLFFACKTDL